MQNLTEALKNTSAPPELQAELVLLKISHKGFDGKDHLGHMVIHKDLANEVQQIFAILYAHDFPIEKMIPISAYDWDDNTSMADNNSSAFNYRYIYKTDRLSNHSFGRAIDLNPCQNPYIALDGSVHPPTATYNPSQQGTICENGIVVQTFAKFGWSWGGYWKDKKDYQHFEKLID